MTKKSMTFEKKLIELETIVDNMEKSNIQLEEMIETYSRAKSLVTELSQELNEINKKIMIINGKGELENFDK